MPPTRGHDLKPFFFALVFIISMMPPTRGHDLKQKQRKQKAYYT